MLIETDAVRALLKANRAIHGDTKEYDEFEKALVLIETVAQETGLVVQPKIELVPIGAGVSVGANVLTREDLITARSFCSGGAQPKSDKNQCA